MNEVSLLFFGQPEELSSSLLSGLNILEFRSASAEYRGLYVLENKFGKQILRKLSLTFSNDESCDWLIYRYLSESEVEKINVNRGERRIYVLLQNYVTLEYFAGLNLTDMSACHFLAGNSESQLKKISYVSPRLKTKNVYIVKSFKPKIKESESKYSGSLMPHFLVAFVKLLLNPIDELGRQSNIFMHSNRRVLARTFELFQFLHFVIKIVVITVAPILRHVLLMIFYKLWGVGVDFGHFFLRVKDKIVATVYYKFIHQLFHLVWLKAVSPVFFSSRAVVGVIWEKMLSPLFYGTIHKAYYQILTPLFYSTIHKAYHQMLLGLKKLYFHSLVLIRHRVWPFVKYHVIIKTHHFFIYRIRHFFLMATFKVYGLCYDLLLLAVRVTKLYLMFPFFKIFWFARFQYNKRIKKFFA